MRPRGPKEKIIAMAVVKGGETSGRPLSVTRATATT